MESAPRNGYDGGRPRNGLYENLYAETIFQSTCFPREGCGITVVPTDGNTTDQPRHFTFDLATTETVDADAATYVAEVASYKAQYGEDYKTAVQRSALEVPSSIRDVGDFDNSPREGWTKLGLLRQGNWPFRVTVVDVR
jgi:hypothetical protein